MQMRSKSARGSASAMASVSALAIAVVCMPGHTADAAMTVTFNYNYLAGQPAYQVPANGSIQVPLYLQESNSDQSTVSLLVNEAGLFSAGAGVSLLSGSAANTITGAQINPAFDDPSSTAGVSGGAATITEFTATTGVLPPAHSQVNGVSEVYLGTVTIHGAAAPGVSSSFTVAGLTDPSTGVGTTFTNTNFYDLDNNVDPTGPSNAAALYSSAAANSFRVTTIAAVPEPAMVSLIIASAVAASARRRRR